MLTEYLLYGGIGLSILLCLFFGISNWIHLMSVSSRASRIETEIEKKTLEFDALRKDKQAGAPAVSGPDTSPKTLAEAMTGITSPEEPTGLDTAAIQVIRNVRGTFENAQDSYMEQTALDVKSHQAEQQAPPQPLRQPIAQPAPPPPATGTVPVPPKTARLFVPGIQASVFQSGATFSQPTAEPPSDATPSVAAVPSDGEREVMDVVSEAPQGAAYGSVATDGAGAAHTEQTRENDIADDPNAVRIILYSQATKDADFVSAWKAISAALQNSRNPIIVLDMSNIMFLYEKEMGYLDKISQLVTLQHGTLRLARCEKELLSALSIRPEIAALAHKKT
jgi:hypothetical protein